MFKLTKADYAAIENRDDEYLNEKGANYYAKGDYENAIEYYRLAAAFGNTYSISDLGYCYMYARSIEKNMALALAYFKIASSEDDVEATYKLGNIYMHGEEGIEQDIDLGLYYYHRACDIIEKNCDKCTEYPSLYFSLAKEHMEGGHLFCDYEVAYKMLMIAKIGYENAINNNIKLYDSAYQSVLELLKDHHFDNIKLEENDYEFLDD